jgi:hypothetical protein
MDLFVPTPAMKLLFQQLQEAFLQAPVQVQFDTAKPICHEMDAFGYSIAGIISQQADNVCNGA